MTLIVSSRDKEKSIWKKMPQKKIRDVCVLCNFKEFSMLFTTSFGCCHCGLEDKKNTFIYFLLIFHSHVCTWFGSLIQTLLRIQNVTKKIKQSLNILKIGPRAMNNGFPWLILKGQEPPIFKFVFLTRL